MSAQRLASFSASCKWKTWWKCCTGPADSSQMARVAFHWKKNIQRHLSILSLCLPEKWALTIHDRSLSNLVFSHVAFLFFIPKPPHFSGSVIWPIRCVNGALSYCNFSWSFILTLSHCQPVLCWRNTGKFVLICKPEEEYLPGSTKTSLQLCVHLQQPSPETRGKRKLGKL